MYPDYHTRVATRIARFLTVSTLAKAIILSACLATVVNADIIAESTDARWESGGTNDYGQSFLVPAGPGWNNLTVNFFATTGNPATTPFAAGTLFLLDTAYSGLQGDLSLTTDGFIAQTSTINNGVWEFASSVTLAADTQYWVYTKGKAITPIAYSDFDAYLGGFAYQDIGGGYTAVSGYDLGFSVSGSLVGIPEPSTTSLFVGVSSLGLVWLLRSRKRGAPVL